MMLFLPWLCVACFSNVCISNERVTQEGTRFMWFVVGLLMNLLYIAWRVGTE